MMPIDKLPLVSIIMPVFNAEKYLAEAVVSVQNQTWTNWELIVVDDGSSDGSLAMAEAFAQHDARIRLIQAAHAGNSAIIRNIGLSHSHGELIGFLDADDTFYPDAIATLAQPLQDNPGLTAVYGFNSEADENGTVLQMHFGLKTDETGAYQLKSLAMPTWYNLIFGWVPCNLGGLMMRRSVYEAIGGFDERFRAAQDLQFRFRLFRHNFSGVRVIPAVVVKYRIHAASITHAANRTEIALACANQLVDFMFGIPELPAELRPMRSRRQALNYKFHMETKHQLGIAFKLLLKAWQDPHIRKMQWAKHCLSAFILMAIPENFRIRLQQLRFQS